MRINVRPADPLHLRLHTNIGSRKHLATPCIEHAYTAPRLSRSHKSSIVRVGNIIYDKRPEDAHFHCADDSVQVPDGDCTVDQALVRAVIRYWLRRGNDRLVVVDGDREAARRADEQLRYIFPWYLLSRKEGSCANLCYFFP